MHEVHESEQVSLLRSYVQTLERQNNAKNHEREILYREIDCLKEENQKILTIFHQKQQEFHTFKQNADLQIEELQRKNLLSSLDHQYIQELQCKDQQHQTIIFNLNQQLQEKHHIQLELRKQLSSLSEQIEHLQKEIQERHPSSENSSINVSQLIENYEKIQAISKERQKQNQQLRIQNSRLGYMIDQLRENIHRRESFPKQQARNSSDTSFTNFPQLKQLIVQNNELIERVTALEKQKNILYAQLTGKTWLKDIQSQNIMASNSLNGYTNAFPFKLQECSSKLQNRIDTLRTENENLLKSLRLI